MQQVPANIILSRNVYDLFYHTFCIFVSFDWYAPSVSLHLHLHESARNKKKTTKTNKKTLAIS